MNVLIFGATSDVAKELARQYSQQNANVTLLGIETQLLGPFQSDIEIRNKVKIDLVEFDILKHNNSDENIKKLISQSDISIILIGYLGNQDKAEKNDDEFARIINLNYSKVIELINLIQRIYVSKKAGIIAGVSSVAGDRGKQSNFVYGSAKAGLSIYLDGLRNRLYTKGVHVVTIKPGFMATKMTKDMDLPKMLTASPNEAAKTIMNAISKRKNKVFINWMWKYIMIIIKAIPEPIFKKMKM